MPFRLFHDLFPEIAERETRSVFLPVAQNGLPAGGYAFKEMFCDEPGCDCRRAFFPVDDLVRQPHCLYWTIGIPPFDLPALRTAVKRMAGRSPVVAK